jgi:hypothetical protein
MSFKGKRWTPGGYYFDEEKGKWIGPDFNDDKSMGLLSKRLIKSKKQPPKPLNGEPKWYPNGWYFDEKMEKWIGPDFESEAEKQEKADRVQRYYERRKAEGKEPTYEEWKALKEAEKHQDE